MDRRQYLGLTGASITALLGGCSSSDSQGTSTATATDTDTESPTATGTATSTPTEVATTTTVAEDDTKFEINRPFQEFITQELMEKPPTRETDDGQEVVKGYDPDVVGPYTEHFAEAVLSQMSNIPDLTPSMRYRDVWEMAGMANWAAKHIHGKELTPEQSFLPTSMAVDNTVVNVVDANFNGPTTLLAQRGDTSKSNILNHEELEDYLNGEMGGPVDIEKKLGAAYTDPNLENKSGYYRWFNLDSLEVSADGAPEEAIGGLHIEFGKQIPDFYPAGRVPARPQVWPHRSMMEYGQDQVVETEEDENGKVSLKYGNLNGVKGEMNHALYVSDARKNDVAILYAEEDGTAGASGIPRSEYDPSEMWAPDDLVPVDNLFESTAG